MNNSFHISKKKCDINKNNTKTLWRFFPVFCLAFTKERFVHLRINIIEINSD